MDDKDKLTLEELLRKYTPNSKNGRPPFTPPVINRTQKYETYYRCTRDGFFSLLLGCETKARYCASNCVCDAVCKDTNCGNDCVPDCSCDGYCSDCDDRGCYMDKPECWGHCLNDWE